MNELNVRIERLGPMRIAYTSAFSDSPEGDAWSKLITWAKPLGLLEDFSNRRLYGFNNPDPTPGKADYGYETWIIIDEEIEPEGEMKSKEFPGGLYAVTSCRGVNNIHSTWMKFAEWCMASKYDFGVHQWLERRITDPDTTSIDDIEFDLYLPIKG